MKLSIAAAALCALALALPGRASALIQIDRGIAGVRLGNSPAQVRAALGKPQRSRKARNEFGPFLLYRYRGGITVFFQGRRRVSFVSTKGLGDRTTRGVGVRSSERAVRRRVRGVKCERIAGSRSCHTNQFKPGRRVTDFFIRRGRVTRVSVGIVLD